VAWGAVRDLYPANIRDRVDALTNRGGLSLSDLSSLATAQLLHDLEDQQDGGDTSKQVSSSLRLLFRIAVVSGGHGDIGSVLVQVPDELSLLPGPDDGDELM